MKRSLAFVGLVVVLILAGAGFLSDNSRLGYGDARVDRLIEDQKNMSQKIRSKQNTLMSEDVDELERRMASLSQDLLKRDGARSRLAAVLKLHLARLYDDSGRGDPDKLRAEATSVLRPSCSQCKKNDAVIAHSPPPEEEIDEWLNGTWWTCWRCDSEEQKPFSASSEERVLKTLLERVGIARGAR